MGNFETIDIKNMYKDLEKYDPFFDRFFNEYSSFENRGYDFYDALTEISAVEKLDRRNFRDYDYFNLNSLIDFIYGSSEHSEMAEIISLVYEKFIRDFLNIPHLDKLFNEKYFEYEWEMHSNLDAKNFGVNFYRDHYFHQARNLYEAYKFFQIGDSVLLKRVLTSIRHSDSSTARFCIDTINASKTYFLGNKKYYEIFRKLSRKEYTDKNEENEGIEEYFEYYALSYIIRGAIYVAALTHDVGYPVDKHLQRTKQFTKFLSNTAFNKNIFDFDNIRNIVEPSILFAIVGAEKIKKALDNHTKCDHGVISALVLLLHFYEHGTLFKLDPLKRAIIEIAALINFDHTASYALGENEKDGRENYPCYQKTPLSIIFRLFDDIQEWDRVYFDVSAYSSIRICAKCKKPMIKQRLIKEISNKVYQRVGSKESTDSFIINEFTKFRHQCGCNSNKWNINYELDYGSYKQQMSFNNKKINYVKVCKRIYYNLIKNSKKTTLEIYIDYNPYKLLEMLRLSNCNFHSHRIEELSKLNRIVESARIDSWEVKILTTIEIEPIYLKQKIIYDFIFVVYTLLTNTGIINFQYIDRFKNVYPLFGYKFNLHKELDQNLLKEFVFNKNYEDVNSSVYFICKNLKLISIPSNKEKNSNKMNIAKILHAVIDAIFPNSGCDKEIASMANYFEPLINVKPKINLTDSHKSESSEIEKDYASYISKIVNSDNYTGVSKDNAGDFKNDTNDFYNDLYLLGLMNDFTEMFKIFLSENF